MTAMTTDGPIYSHADSIHIDAPPSKVWAMVTAMERYGEWSPENTGGYWRKKPDGTLGTGQVGDEFVGVNRRGEQEWKALVEIVEREEERSYAFVTGGTNLNFVHWRYELERAADGATVLTEQWALRNLSPIMVEKGDAEVAYRVENARESIGATLAGLKLVGFSVWRGTEGDMYVTFPSRASTVTRRASISALRLNAASILSLSTASGETNSACAPPASRWCAMRANWISREPRSRWSKATTCCPSSTRWSKTACR